MRPNPVLHKLGFAPDDRVVIIHADDIGMCQATVTAYADLMDAGIVSSAAVMVTCSWFPLVADYCRQHPQVDMGVHLTLTAEWDTYRWGPISTRNPASGLMDEEGYFYRSARAVQNSADPAAVQIELETQVQTALASGIDATHIDTHMLSAMYPPFLQPYFSLSRQHRIPMMFLRSSQIDEWLSENRGEETAEFARQQIQLLEDEGLPLVDYFDGSSLIWDDSDDRLEAVKHLLANLQPGITHFILHPAVDTPEIRAIAPDWRCRVSDYEVFSNPELRAFIKHEGIRIINYRVLRDLLRGASEPALR